MYRKILFFLIISSIIAITSTSGAEIDFEVKLDNTPEISRFRGFTAVIPPESLEKIDKDSISLFINGEDYSNQLQFNMDSKSGELYVTFDPTYPLPMGTVVEKLSGLTSTGDYFEKYWTITVDPMANNELAHFYTILESDPSNIKAYLNIANIYETKYLFKDAQNGYLTVLQMDPTNEAARKAYDRIFSLWDHKMIKHGNLSIEVYMDAGLLDLGKLIIFNLKVTNTGEEQISITPATATLIDEGGKQFPIIDSLPKYPKKALDKQWISIDDYARLSYYLKSHSFPLIGNQDLSPMASVEGFLIFSFGTESNVPKIFLSIPEQDVGGNKESFLFPFVLP